MKLIVGLGNPGKEYDNTRHNIGFIFIDDFAKSLNIRIDKKKFNGLYNEVVINNEKVILLKPQTFMNLSGESVIKFINYYKINIDDILIISDDLDLNFGKIRLRSEGSSGGHNGLNNIILHLGTNKFKRLKIGISCNKPIDTISYVLGKFSKEEKEIIDNTKSTINHLLSDFVSLDFEKLMSIYNKK